MQWKSAGKQIEDESLRDAMKDSGLGTPATRASTIERLKHVGYIAMEGKRMAITQKGRTAIEVIREAGVTLLTSPEMTGQWERRLNEIARGTASDQEFIQKVKQFAQLIVDKVKGAGSRENAVLLRERSRLLKASVGRKQVLVKQQKERLPN